jgi:hypothetical protein
MSRVGELDKRPTSRGEWQNPRFGSNAHALAKNSPALSCLHCSPLRIIPSSGISESQLPRRTRPTTQSAVLGFETCWWGEEAVNAERGKFVENGV